MSTPPEGAFAAALRRRDPAAIDELLGTVLLPTAALVPRPWGGDAIARHTGRAQPARPIGESFELAAAPSDAEAAAFPSEVILPDGDRMPLIDVLHACPQILGDAHVLAFGHELPLLPKLLDVQSLLSVQAHPAGNPELYVILGAVPGATMYLGLREDTDPTELAASLHKGAALQREVAAFVGDREALAQGISSWLLGDREATLADSIALPCAPIATQLAGLRRLGTELLGRMHALEVTPGMVVHNCVRHPQTGRPSATLHALGNPERRPILALEIRCAGPTFRAWDHGRLPMRALDIDAAVANVPTTAQSIADFVVPPDKQLHEIANGVFSAECVTVGSSGVGRERGRAELVHVCSGTVAIDGPRGRTLLKAGASALVPATWMKWTLRTTADATARVVIASISPIATALTKRTAALRRVRDIVTESVGPRDVLAIANGGDGPIVAARFEAARHELFRSDGTTRIVVHEEPTRRGQLMGMIDAVRGWTPATPDDVALGIMLPGQGTRLSPVTQRLHGIKPFVPMPIRTHASGPWLSAAAASLHSWVLVAEALRGGGFAGIAWKWGDEPQLPSAPLVGLALGNVDAVRFGKRATITEDLARNKEWLLAGRDGRLVAQVRRRPADALRERLAAAGAGTESLVHIGSPALSHRFMHALVAEFGDVGGWLDIDGYLFEALTHDAAAWQREVERDAGLRTMLAGCPDFYARASAVRARIESERGGPLSIMVIDCGADTWWGDMGQLVSAKDAFARLATPGPEGELARRLAVIDDVVPDRFGNRVVDAHLPDDGSVRDSVILGSFIGGGSIRSAVVIDSNLGDATIGRGTVVLHSTIALLEAGDDAWVFRAIGEHTHVPSHGVHTTMPSDPGDPGGGVLEQWAFDMREDPSAGVRWTQPFGSNPQSFRDKATQMRQRARPIDDVDSDLESVHATPLIQRIRST